tara:strand:- start:575 stop:1522 length:948 start_codon:yes stop_codon:yes gene_type:complete
LTETEYIKDLKTNGFSKIEQLFSSEDILKLKSKSYKILDDAEEINFDHKLLRSEALNPYVNIYRNNLRVRNFFNQKLRNCLGVDKEIDLLMSKFFSNDKINNILNYFFIHPKIHGCTIRMADKSSDWLGVHSDSDTTISMSILLEDTNKKDSTTTFIKGSHLYKYPVKNKIERLNPNIFSNLFSYTTGKAGDVGIFFNRTAHGVVKQKIANHGRKNTVILLGFHCDHDIKHRNLLFPETTLYGKNINALSDNLLKFFETKKDLRESRIGKNQSQSEIKKINSTRKLNFREYLIYVYLRAVAIVISILKKVKSIAN